MKKVALAVSTVMVSVSLSAGAKNKEVTDEVIAKQRAALAENTANKGFGPQAPRDIDSTEGSNNVVFNLAPAANQMNLCNIHFHKGAEHKGGQFTTYAGNGDGQGFGTGYLFSGELSESELAPVSAEICPSKHGALQSGDTIEVHYVHSTAKIQPGPTLGSCMNESINNPQLRVEGQVYVLVNDANALDFKELNKLDLIDGYHQAPNIPNNTGEPIVYSGSTTGGVHNKFGSPFQVTWSVRPEVAKVNIESVGAWCQDNVFEEDHAHSVRNLVTNPDLLAPIQ